MDKTTKQVWSNSKNVSPEILAKRKKINIRIYKFGCLPIIIIFGLLYILIQPASKEIVNNDPLNIGIDSLNTLIGAKIPLKRPKHWGSSGVLKGTNNMYYIAYLDSANVSYIATKSNRKIIFADFGRNAANDYIDNIALKRKELIQNQFSYFDGSHRKLEKLIKNAMNDPDSYEHVETKYKDMNTHVFVITKYRGNNAFGGKVLGSVSANYSLDGDLIKIINQQ